MYAKLLIKQAQYARDYNKNPREGTAPVRGTKPAPVVAGGSKPEPGTVEGDFGNVYADLMGNDDSPMSNLGRVIDFTNRRVGDAWNNKLATALGIGGGFVAGTDGRALLSDYVQRGEGVGLGPLRSLRPHPIQATKEISKILKDKDVRTPVRALKDISGSVSRRDFLNQAKLRASPIEVAKEVIKSRRIRRKTPYGTVRAVLQRLLSNDFGKSILHNSFLRKPNQTKGGWKRLTASALTGGLISAGVAAQIKKEMNKAKAE